MTRLQFNNTVIQLGRKLYLVAYRFLQNREEAEDAVQDVFIKLWNKRDQLDKYDSVEALATATIKNHCIDQLRKIKTIGLDNNSRNLPYFFNEPTPYEQLERDETSEILNKIIDKLPDIYKEIIIKREIDGLSYEEIAQNTSHNINTLRVTLSRARVMIRDEFKKYNYEHNGNKKAARKIL
jgi:RNA polymerase sigma-70 factor (ECF subfamily)